MDAYYPHSMIEYYVTAAEGAHVYINEEGRIMNPPLPRNPFFAEDLRGDVIEIGEEVNEAGENLGLPDDYVLRSAPKLPEFKKGDKVTMFFISDSMPMTVTCRWVATGQTFNGQPYFKETSRSRKEFTMRKEKMNEALIFAGHDLPFTTDAEAPAKSDNGFTVRQFRMNALFNFAGDPDTIRDYILNKNLNPFFMSLDRINHVDGEKETLLFPHVNPSCRMVAEKQAKQLGIPAPTIIHAS